MYDCKQTLQANRHRTRRLSWSGFTLVELLVVMGIIGTLVALTLPAVQSARESARQVTCRNNVRQLALAALQHESAQAFYPTGGWAYNWVGDPDRGFGADQPGGWIFNILPYVEEAPLRSLARGYSPAGKRERNAKLMRSSLAVSRCPSRRQPELSMYGAELAPRNALFVNLVAKADYAINAGDAFIRLGAGPESYREADSGAFEWNDNSTATGLSFLRSRVVAGDILDGASKTYLVGEKYVARNMKPSDIGNDQRCSFGERA